jgi:hypothetical protein
MKKQSWLHSRDGLFFLSLSLVSPLSLRSCWVPIRFIGDNVHSSGKEKGKKKDF